MVYICNICGTDEEGDDQHRVSTLHRFNYALQDYHQNRLHIRSNRHGIQLSFELVALNGFRPDFTVEPDKKGRHFLNITPEKFQTHGNLVEFKCIVKNARRNNEDPIVITYAGVLTPYEPFSMLEANNNNEGHRKFHQLEIGATFEAIVRLTLEENHVSNFCIPVYFSFQTHTKENQMKSFSIARSIVVSIRNEIIEETPLDEKSPFTSNKWEKVEECRPPKKNFHRFINAYPIPKGYFRTLICALKRDFGDGILQEIMQKLEPGYVTLENYKDFFHILLWLEEACVTLGLNCYNMENVNLTNCYGDVLELVVPGLAEKRPSVVKGDLIEIKVHGDHTSYQGVIQKVGDRTVEIHFLDDFIVDAVKFEPSLEIDVRFVLGRIHFERMHAGVDQVVSNGFVRNLFPPESLASGRISEPVVITQNELFNKRIYTNAEQLTAVQKIVNNTSKGAAYIVYGPPGTGKTVTIVEAIYQLVKRTKKRILVCAPANAACNMLTDKLSEFCSESELKRVMSDNCDTSSVHDNTVRYCNILVEDGEKVVVPFPDNELNKYRVLVTTLVLAGKYSRKYHPDVVFIDEAAQAREPEACCAISLLMEDKQLILAGDPKQLGPVIHSEVCKEYKYDVSILERLMNLPIYENDTRNNFITMLKLNFRSHPDILRLPNKMFYDNHLKAVSVSALNDPLATQFVYKRIVGAKNQINKGSPIEFCSVLALERREGRSPSYYNPSELLLVVKYVKHLLAIEFDNPALNVTSSQIGIVTPYIRQVYKIRAALSPYPDIEVGTTEAFQGREKRVIIISTVRGQEDLLLFDQMYKLGFVREPKRFNVAITRAKSKLIVIGNPLVLTKDPKWKDLIDQARGSNTFCGAPYQERTRDVQTDIMRRMKNVKLHDR